MLMIVSLPLDTIRLCDSRFVIILLHFFIQELLEIKLEKLTVQLERTQV